MPRHRLTTGYCFCCQASFSVFLNPGIEHWKAVLRIFACLKETLEHGFQFDAETSGLQGFSDSDYAGDSDTLQIPLHTLPPLNITGFVFILHGRPITRRSRFRVVLFTTEAELVVIFKARKKGVWFGRLMVQISPGWTRPISLMCHNRSTIDLIRNPVLHQRTKNIEVRMYFSRERQEAGYLKILQVSTDDQLADPLTKPLPNLRFSLLRDLMGIKMSQNSCL